MLTCVRETNTVHIVPIINVIFHYQHSYVVVVQCGLVVLVVFECLVHPLRSGL